MKKLLISMLLITLLMGVNVYADNGQSDEKETVSPKSDMYDTARLIENNEYELTSSNTEKALLQNDFADRRLKETEEMLAEENDETVNKLMNDYNDSLDAVDENLEKAINKNEEGALDIEAKIIENSERRKQKLEEMLAREDLPEQAKAGITKAFENHQRAMLKLKESYQNHGKQKNGQNEMNNSNRENKSQGPGKNIQHEHPSSEADSHNNQQQDLNNSTEQPIQNEEMQGRSSTTSTSKISKGSSNVKNNKNK